MLFCVLFVSVLLRWVNLTSRLLGLDLFDKNAIEFCARKVASVSGDVRRALQICRFEFCAECACSSVKVILIPMCLPSECYRRAAEICELEARSAAAAITEQKAKEPPVPSSPAKRKRGGSAASVPSSPAKAPTVASAGRVQMKCVTLGWIADRSVTLTHAWLIVQAHRASRCGSIQFEFRSAAAISCVAGKVRACQPCVCTAYA